MTVMASKLGFLIAVVVSITCFFSCDSEDIDPVLTLEISDASLNEDGGSATITARLNGAASDNFSIPVSFTGTASASDYSLSAEVITISRGDSTGSITVTGVSDESVEGDEIIEIAIGNPPGFLVLSDQNFMITLLDGDTDSDGDGVPDASDECPGTAGEVANNGCPFVGFIINEVLYDPPADNPGDANGDGIREAQGDEFIEFYNSTANAIDLSGYTISDDEELRHTFPEGTLVPSNGVIVVFGGGTPTGSFGGAIVQTASEGLLNMNNAGDIVTVRDDSDNVVVTFDINPLSGNPDEAYTRSPDIYGDFARYRDLPEAGGALFTPGTTLDGSAF